MNTEGQGKWGRLFERKSWIIYEEEWPRINLLLVILGIEVTLIGGFWIWNNYPWYYAMLLAVPIGALLLRSWWALLIVPLVFAVGIGLGILLLPLLQGGWSALQDRLSGGMEGLDILLFFGTPVIIALAALGAAVGVALGKWIKRMREAGSFPDR